MKPSVLPRARKGAAAGQPNHKPKGTTVKKTIRIDEENVLTLRDIAEELKRLYHWQGYRLRARDGVISFTASDGRLFDLHQTGFAYEVKAGVAAEDSDDAHAVDFRDDLDCPDLVWAEDEDGNALALHS